MVTSCVADLEASLEFITTLSTPEFYIVIAPENVPVAPFNAPLIVVLPVVSQLMFPLAKLPLPFLFKDTDVVELVGLIVIPLAFAVTVDVPSVADRDFTVTSAALASIVDAKFSTFVASILMSCALKFN